MNKKYLHLYAALFLVSLLVSATVISAYAAPDSQQTTTITYNVPSAAERNTYEINIPSSVDISYGEIEKEIPITINDNYNLESSYTVYVDVAKSTFNTNPESNIYKYVRLYNASTRDYYYALELKNSNDNQLYYKYNDDTTKNLCVASFHSDSSQNTGGILKLSYVGEKSNDTSYHDSASYTGSITFDIYGEYE